MSKTVLTVPRVPPVPVPTVPPVPSWRLYYNDVSMVTTVVDNSTGSTILCYVQNKRLWLKKIDSSGQSRWIRDLDFENVNGNVNGNVDSIAVTINEKSSSIYVLINGNYLIKTDEVNIIWCVDVPLLEYSTIKVNRYDQVYLVGVTESDGIVVILFDSNGQIVWKYLHNDLNAIVWSDFPSVVVDAYELYIAYYDATPEQRCQEPMGEIIIHKIDNKGNKLWICRQTVSNTNENKIKPCLSVGGGGGSGGVGGCSSNDVYVIYGGGSPPLQISKLDSNGQVYWRHQYSSFSEQLIPSLTIDQYGDLYSTFLNVNNGLSIRKLNGEGQVLWESVHSYINFELLTQESIEVQLSLDLCGNLYLLSGYDGVAVRQLLPTAELHPSIAVDESGFVYCVYQTNVNQGDSPNESGYDIVIIKKDNKGRTLWQLRDPLFNTVSDNMNPIIVVYQTSCYVVYQIADGVMILKLDTDGRIEWVRSQTAYHAQLPTADCDSEGNLYVSYQSFIKTTYDLVIFMMDSKGSIRWIRRGLDYHNNKTVPSLKYDRANDVLYLAYISQTLADYRDIMLLKLDADGQPVVNSKGHAWFAQHSILNTELSNDEPVICLDQQGFLYFCYTTRGGTVRGGHKTGRTDLVIGKMNHDGAVVRLVQTNAFNTIEHNQSPAITYRSGSLYIAYQTTGTVTDQTKTGLYDIVVMKLNAITLDVVWIIQNNRFNSKNNNLHPVIEVDKDHNCYVMFECDGTIGDAAQIGHGSRTVLCQINPNGTFGWIRR